MRSPIATFVTIPNDLLARLIYPGRMQISPIGARAITRGWAATEAERAVTRLLVSPLLIAVKKGRGGSVDYIDYLRAFAIACRANLPWRPIFLPDLPSRQTGLEIGVLSEAWRKPCPKSVCSRNRRRL